MSRRTAPSPGRPRTRLPGSAPVLLCAVGLLLTAVQVSGFGFDFTDDAVGFALVAAGAHALDRRGEPGSGWWRLTGVAAAASAVLSLLSYGGAVGRFLSYASALWTGVSYALMLTSAAVVAGVALGLRPSLGLAAEAEAADRLSRVRWPAVLRVAAVAVAASALCGVVLLVTGHGYDGPLGYLRQALGVVTGLGRVLTVVAAFVAAGRSARAHPG